MKKLFSIFLFITTVLTAEEVGVFNFILDDGGTEKSISGHRAPNGDGTDTVKVYNPSGLTYRLLTDTGTGLAVPVTINSFDLLYLEVTETGGTYILGVIEHSYLKDVVLQQQFQTAAILASILMLIFILSWHAQKLTK